MLVSIDVYRDPWAVKDAVMENLPWMLRKSVAELLSTSKNPVKSEEVELLVRDANKFDSNARELVISITTKRTTPLARNKKLVTELAKRCRTMVNPIYMGEDITVDRVIESLIEIGPRNKASREVWATEDDPWNRAGRNRTAKA